MSKNTQKEKLANAFGDRGKTIVPILLSVFILFTSISASSSDKQVVLFPFAVYAESPLEHIRKGAASMLASRLAAGGVTIMGQDKVWSHLTQEEKKGITSEQRAEELVEELHAQYGIFGSITAIGDGYSIDLALVHVGITELPRITRVSKVANADQFIHVFSEAADQLRGAIQGKEVSAAEVQKPSTTPKKSPGKALFSKVEQTKPQASEGDTNIAFKPLAESKPFQPTGTIQLNMAVMSFDAGDLDGDGTLELVMVSRKKMLVYQREEDIFVLKDSRKASWGEEFLKVSVGDIDKNGAAEIYVVSLYGMRARSSVFERVTDFTRLARMTGHLRVVKDPFEMKSLLLFQDSKVNEFFSGPIYRMQYANTGELTKEKALPQMKEAQFYTLLSTNLDPGGNDEWVGLGEQNLNEQSKLQLWGRGGTSLWQGEKDVGGTNNAVRLGNAPPGELPPRITFNSRLILTDVDGDSSEEILAVQNIPLIEHTRDFRVYTKSRLIAYERQDSGFVPRWATGTIEYCIADVQVYGQTLFVAAHKGKVLNIGKETGCIMWVE